MTVKGGPKIETDGLVFHLDAAAASIGKSYPIDGLDVEYLIVAGGGGGGGSPHGAGGGAGGLLTGATKATISTGTYSIVIGAGGAGKVGTKTSPWPSSGTNYGANGGNSTAFGKTALGGGGGGGYSGGGGNDTVGRNGGSGGGTGRDPSSVGQATQPSSSDGGYGNNGGRGGYQLNHSYNHAGGGGGAGGAGYLIGSTLDTSKVSFGGIGKYFGDKYSQTLGYNGWFAGGGGGSYYSSNVPTRLNAGLGGGGRGGYSGGDPDPGNGSANTGGGGGGAERSSASDATGGDGGSGVVLIRYKGSQKASGGDSIIKHRGYTVHVFTSSGNFVVGDRVGGTSRNKTVGELKNMGSSNYSSGNRGYWTFDGTDECIDLNNNFSSVVGVSLPSTWSAFVYLNATNNNETIIGSAWTSGGVLFRKTGSPHTPSNRIRFLYFTNGSNGTGFDSASTFTSGWYHLVATYNGSGLSYGNFSFFANGIQQSITNPTFGTPTTVPNRDFSIGGVLTDDTAYWSGKISVVSIYNRVLSDLEILDLYNATKGRFGL